MHVRSHWSRHAPWLAAGLFACLGVVALLQWRVAQLHEEFDTQARIAHRLLSQRVVQHDAILATLATVGMGSAAPPSLALSGLQALSKVYPQIVQVRQRLAGQSWPADWACAEAAERSSRAQSQPALCMDARDWAQGRYGLVAAAGPGAYALQIDLLQTVPWEEWPFPAQGSPVTVRLALPGWPAFSLSARSDGFEGAVWRFDFEKKLAAESQPFKVVLQGRVGWADWPWIGLGAWLALVLGASVLWRAWRGQAQARRRAEELLRLGQVSRLNTLGELAAGLAHELNQPLTAILANTRAGARLLDEEAPELPLVREAMAQAVQQARRAADVVGRLRRVVERPALGQALQALDLEACVRGALHLLEPELLRRQVQAELILSSPVPAVLADPVAVEQIVHNLLMNALQALDSTPTASGRITLRLVAQGPMGALRVTDNGPGLSPEVMTRLFQPFFSTREGGLGLGLSLCETLASGMGGSLTAAQASPRGAEFTLSLPLASP
ncbi:ATP-binding protein [Curvibacter sp. HBC28]|uniref:histidine kinase n=1 Tax=Curvibacter microcysteis TaxID=3026419 RepID=A0ABT5MIE5_9BURK|nr:ATP-binding protein [Curvibacter sp. HBC28]MDD0814950.1 ATP-binding protein [Curvibacter sp. HBC28]